MVLIIFSISLEQSLIFVIASTMEFIMALLLSSSLPVSEINALMSRAFWAVWVTWVDRSFRVAASSSTELACSVAPWLRACAPLDT